MDDNGWQFIQSNNRSYIVRRCFSTTNFIVLLSDHVRLWSAEGTANELLLMSLKENPLCEFDLSKITKNIFSLFDKSLNSLSVVGSNETLNNLKMCSSLGNRPFNLIWTLNEEGPDALFKEVTGPLLYCLGEMSRRQNYLCHQITLKDREINDHILENGPLKWGSKFKSEKFNEEEFRNEPFTLSHNDQDPIKIAWEETEIQSMFNKAVLLSKKKDEDESPAINEVIVKQEQVIPETVNEIEHEAVVTQVKEDKVVEESHVKTSRTKRKKVKLNI